MIDGADKVVWFVIPLRGESRGSKVGRIIYAGPKGYRNQRDCPRPSSSRAVLVTELGCREVVCRSGFPVVAMQDSNKKSGPFMEAATLHAKRHTPEGGLFSGAVELTCEFYFSRPKSHLGTGRNAGTVKRSAPEFHQQKPDLDKITRAVADVLTGTIYEDDKQVVRYGREHGKNWTTGEEKIVVTVRPLTERDRQRIVESEPPF